MNQISMEEVIERMKMQRQALQDELEVSVLELCNHVVVGEAHCVDKVVDKVPKLGMLNPWPVQLTEEDAHHVVNTAVWYNGAGEKIELKAMPVREFKKHYIQILDDCLTAMGQQ